jgi:DNA ligase-1
MFRFAQNADQIAATTKKLQKTALLSEYFKSVHVEEAAIAAVFFSGRPFAVWEETTLQVGGTMLWRIVGELSGRSESELTAAYREHGDLGSVAAAVLHDRKHGDRPPSAIQKQFRELAAARGPAAKGAIVRQLLTDISPLEAKYVIKIMTGDLRIGLKESLVEEAIAKAFPAANADKESALAHLKAVQRANMLLGDIGETLKLAAEGRLAEAKMRLFHPIGFMLASPAENAEDALAYFQNAWVEDKYDGIRAQAHCSGNTVRFFSRTRDEITESFPELPDALAGLPGDAILDGEIVAWSYLVDGAADDARDDRLEDDGTDPSKDNLSLSSEQSAPSSAQTTGLANSSGSNSTTVPAQEQSASSSAPTSGLANSSELNPTTAAAPEERNTLAQRVSAGKAAAHEQVPEGRHTYLGRALPFSALQQRLGRKKVSHRLMRDVPVAYVVFDVLYAGDELLIDRPLRERAKILERLLAEQKPVHHGDALRLRSGQDPTRRISKDAKGIQPKLDFSFEVETSGASASDPREPMTESALPTTNDVRRTTKVIRAPVFQATSPEELDALFDAAQARGNEGLMIKYPESPYTPGRRGKSWLKLKRELATLDVVVTAAEYGHGKRIGVLSDYTFAVRDGDRLLNIGKAYSGLTDVEIAEMTKWFLDHTIEDQGFRRIVEPKIVLEVAFNNVMKSDRHSSGYALRFPRIVRLRPDKLPEEADTLERAKEIYEKQGY